MFNCSVFIITYNEENDISKCLDSVSWSDDVIVLDSFSSDETIDICQRYKNVKVYQRKFDDFSSQRNFGLHEIEYKNKYVLILDADECCTPELKEFVFNSLDLSSKEGKTYAVRRSLVFENKVLRKNSSYDAWIERIVIPSQVKYIGVEHEKIEYKNQIQFVDSADILHYQFSKGVEHWFERRIAYAKLKRNKLDQIPIIRISTFLSEPSKRRSFLRQVLARFKFGCLIFFMYNFFVKLCFLDGFSGIKYVYLESRIQYEYTKNR